LDFAENAVGFGIGDGFEEAGLDTVEVCDRPQFGLTIGRQFSSGFLGLEGFDDVVGQGSQVWGRDRHGRAKPAAMKMGARSLDVRSLQG